MDIVKLITDFSITVLGPLLVNLFSGRSNRVRQQEIENAIAKEGSSRRLSESETALLVQRVVQEVRLVMTEDSPLIWRDRSFSLRDPRNIAGSDPRAVDARVRAALAQVGENIRLRRAEGPLSKVRPPDMPTSYESSALLETDTPEVTWQMHPENTNYWRERIDAARTRIIRRRGRIPNQEEL